MVRVRYPKKFTKNKFNSHEHNQIELPDFVPLEQDEGSFHSNRGLSKERTISPPDTSVNHNKRKHFSERDKRNGSLERFKEMKSSQQSFQTYQFGSTSPVSLKVTARIGNCGNKNFSNNNNNNILHFNKNIDQMNSSVFNRLGSNHQTSRSKHSPIIFDLNDSKKVKTISLSQVTSRGLAENKQTILHSSLSAPLENILPNTSSPPVQRTNAVVQTDETAEFPKLREIEKDSTVHDEQDLLDALRKLETEQKQLVTHCDGLRDTVDDYLREIAKLETIIYKWSQEIEILKRRILK